MYDNFYDFYQAAGTGGGRQPRWRQLEEVLKISERNYPTNQRLLDYYTDTFRCNTSALMRSKWHSMDKLLYVWVVSKWCDIHNKNILALEKRDFAEFARILGVSESLLEFKWLKLAKPYVKNIPWEIAEDQLLTELMKTIASKKWTELALNLFESGVSRILRTAKQVRERWVNYLDPALNRKDWQESEDVRLLQTVKQLGRKWSEIGKLFHRTENNVKNRFNSLISKGMALPQDQTSKKAQTGRILKQQTSRSSQAQNLKFEISVEKDRTATFKPLASKICTFRTFNYADLPSDSD